MARTGENIYKRKDGRWEGRYIYLYEPSGKAKYRYVYARSYSEVKNKLLLAKSHKPESLFCYTGSEKYSFWLNKWLMCKKPYIKESTYIRYKNHIENHIEPELGGFPVNRISSVLIEDFVSRKLQHGRLDNSGGLSPKTISDILGVIKGSFKYARSHGAVAACSFENISLRNSSKEMRVLSNSEEQRLLKVLFTELDRYKLGVFICLYTGIRIGELCALGCDHISLSDRTLKVEKTMQRLQCDSNNSGNKTQITITKPKSFAAERVIPIPDFMLDIIKPFVSSPNSFILTGDCKLFVEPRTMQNRFKTYLGKAQIPDANFHCLRHTFATRCIEAGFDIKTLSEILGHSSVKITLDKYVHSSMQLKRNNMEKLQTLFI